MSGTTTIKFIADHALVTSDDSDVISYLAGLPTEQEACGAGVGPWLHHNAMTGEESSVTEVHCSLAAGKHIARTWAGIERP